MAAAALMAFKRKEQAMTRSLLMTAIVMMLLIHAHPLQGQQEQVRKLSDLNTPGEWAVFQWNRAPARIQVRPEFPDQLKGQGDREESLGMKVQWPGGEGFYFASIVPSNKAQFTVPFRLKKVSLWVKGDGSGHHGEIHFEHEGSNKDARGQDMKVSFGGPINWNDWRQVQAVIPQDWPQPLTIRSITLHSWGVPATVETTHYFTRLEVTVDPNERVDGPKPSDPSTDDSW